MSRRDPYAITARAFGFMPGPSACARNYRAERWHTLTWLERWLARGP